MGSSGPAACAVSVAAAAVVCVAAACAASACVRPLLAAVAVRGSVRADAFQSAWRFVVCGTVKVQLLVGDDSRQ